MPASTVTQKEIAEKLNISRSLVARALKGHTEVSAKTRLRIEEAAREMGYDSTANSAARELAGKRYGKKTKNGIFAVMINNTSEMFPSKMPFYEPVFSGMEAESEVLGTDICLCFTGRTELPRLIREHKCDGVVALVYAEQVIEQTKALGIPVVLFHSFSEITHCAMADDYDGARQATKHLLELGHRRIAFMSVADWEDHPGKMRLKGYRDAMLEFGAPIHEEWIEEDLLAPESTANSYCVGCDECAACIGWQTIKANNNIQSSRELPFTAMICHNDAVAMGVIAHARADGYEVPRDLSVVAFDNISREYRFSPQITSVDLSLHELGKNTIRLLNKLVRNSQEGDRQYGDETSYERPQFPVSLQVHESTRAVSVKE